MSKFNVGDVVRRRALHNDAYWDTQCEINDKSQSGSYLVTKVIDVAICLEGFGHAPFFPDKFYKIITENCMSDTIAQLRSHLSLCCGTTADKPAVLLLVDKLDSEIQLLRNAALEPESRLHQKGAQQELLETQLRAEITRLRELLETVQRDKDALANERDDYFKATQEAAKALGTEVHELRRSRRELRLHLNDSVTLLYSLEAGVTGIDLHGLSAQLTAIGNVCDDACNGADAQIAHDAAQVVGMVQHTLTRYLALLDE